MMFECGNRESNLWSCQTCDVRNAASVCNLEHTHNGHTVLEYLTGEIPRTHRDLVTQTEIPEILHGLDSDFLDQLRHLLHEQNASVQIGRDDDARYNAIVRDANVGRQRATYPWPVHSQTW